MKIQDPHRIARRIIFGRAPIDAQLIVSRRCNLSCGYCTEFDDHSAEVPFDALVERIDALHRLDVINISMLGGEPLLHSRIADLVEHAGRRAQVSITTNAFLLSPATIKALNAAGLSNMQVSIDAMESDPTRYVQKTFKSLRPKLERLALLADFAVHCNLVLCKETLEQFDDIYDALADFPVGVSVNLVHDDRGRITIEGEEYIEKWKAHFRSGRALSFIEKRYGRALLTGGRPRWRCRSGSRYLYVDEFGKVQYCSSQRGRLDVPITSYTKDDLRIQGRTTKGCESGCSIFCAFRASQIDNAPVQTLASLAQSALFGSFLGTGRGRPGRQGIDRPNVAAPNVAAPNVAARNVAARNVAAPDLAGASAVRSPRLRVLPSSDRGVEASDSASASAPRDLDIPLSQ